MNACDTRLVNDGLALQVVTVPQETTEWRTRSLDKSPTLPDDTTIVVLKNSTLSHPLHDDTRGPTVTFSQSLFASLFLSLCFSLPIVFTYFFALLSLSSSQALFLWWFRVGVKCHGGPRDSRCTSILYRQMHHRANNNVYESFASPKYQLL